MGGSARRRRRHLLSGRIWKRFEDGLRVPRLQQPVQGTSYHCRADGDPQQGDGAEDAAPVQGGQEDRGDEEDQGWKARRSFVKRGNSEPEIFVDAEAHFKNSDTAKATRPQGTRTRKPGAETKNICTAVDSSDSGSGEAK